MKLQFPLLCAFYALPASLMAQGSPNIQKAPKPEILSIDNGTAKIGIDKSKGASITWLSWDGYPKNTINIHDPGRLLIRVNLAL